MKTLEYKTKISYILCVSSFKKKTRYIGFFFNILSFIYSTLVWFRIYISHQIAFVVIDTSFKKVMDPTIPAPRTDVILILLLKYRNGR